MRGSKSVLNPRIKINKKGQPYIDVKTAVARIEKRIKFESTDRLSQMMNRSMYGLGLRDCCKRELWYPFEAIEERKQIVHDHPLPDGFCP